MPFWEERQGESVGGREAFFLSKIPTPFGPALVCKRKTDGTEPFREAAARCPELPAGLPSLHPLPLCPCPTGISPL